MWPPSQPLGAIRPHVPGTKIFVTLCTTTDAQLQIYAADRPAGPSVLRFPKKVTLTLDVIGTIG